VRPHPGTRVYTVWTSGQKLGETRFELSPEPRKRAGVFHPTEFGLSALPGITAMFPALLAFEAMCRKAGVAVDDDRRETAAGALDAFANTPEGRAVQAAAHQIAQLELRDPSGRILAWESIMISDTTELLELAARYKRRGADEITIPQGDPVRFLISTTLARSGTLADEAMEIGAEVTTC
jgi:hypothetical protein